MLQLMCAIVSALGKRCLFAIGADVMILLAPRRG